MTATIIVETGGIISNANSYVSAADLATYAANRGVTITGTSEDLLIKAMDYIESLEFIGIKYSKDQALQWPRSGAYIDGYGVDSDVIPTQLKNGQMAAALAIDAGNGPLANIERATKREKVGELEVEYMSGASSSVIVKTVNAALYKLLKGGVGANTIRVSKA